MDDMIALTCTENIDLINITESWTKEEDELLTEIPGYSKYSRHRVVGRGGGVLIYVRQNLGASFRERDDIQNISPDVEAVWIELKHKENVVLIGNIYRPPNQCLEYIELIQRQIEYAIRKGDVIITGDFNFPHINWDNTLSVREDGGFLEFLKDCYLTQHVKFNTRDDAILDLIITSNPFAVDNVEIGEHLGDSDHNIIRFDILFKRNMITNNMLVPDIRRANFDKLRYLLKNTDWGITLNKNSTEEKWKNFKEILDKTTKQCIPLKNRRTVNHQPRWFNKEVKDKFIKKQRLFKIFKSTKSDLSKEQYQYSRKVFKQTLQRTKLELELKLANNINRDPKAFYSYINKKQKIKAHIGPLSCDGKLVSENQEMANVLNDFFASVFTRGSIIIRPQQNDKVKVLNDLVVDRSEVVRLIKGIRIHKAPGPDNIYPRILHEVVEEVAEALVDIFSSTLNTGEVPEDWKRANVIPIFKSGSIADPSNYRPVSLTSVIGKIFESMLKKHIWEHLERHELIRKTQHGFISGRSCLTNLLEFYEKVTSLLDKGDPIDIIYLDFKKAFDKVDHSGILRKLNTMGIRGKILKWVEGWLFGRRQRVMIGGQFSRWIDVTSGVPQGSVLGPLLFLVYINDLDDNIFNIMSKFADDVKMMGEARDSASTDTLQNDLNKMCLWAKNWNMIFNVDKCCVLHLGKNNCRRVYQLDGKMIKSTIEVRDLGVSISDTLKPSCQCARAAKKANQMMGMILRGIECRSKKVLMPLYRSLVRPHLEYAVQFWSPYYKKDILMLERVQRRATKNVCEVKGQDYEDRIRELNLISLDRRRTRGDLIQVFKIMKKKIKVDPKTFFELRVGITRGHRLKIFKPRARILLRQNFFTCRVVEFWNMLPEEVVEADCVTTFKKRLDMLMTMADSVL